MDCPNKYQRSAVSLHADHDPNDPRVAVVEDLAMIMCSQCSGGVPRWRDRQSGEYVHDETFSDDASDCEAHNMLHSAAELDIPIYTGAELRFETETAAVTPLQI